MIHKVKRFLPVLNYLSIILLFLNENTWGSSVYMKSPLDSAAPLSMLKTTGPVARLSLDPAIHCTNVLFNVLNKINCMDFRYDMHTQIE